MRIISLSILFSVIGAANCVAQHFVPTKAFAAVIVNDINKSERWYSRLFELSPVRQVDEASAKIRIMESRYLVLELLELKDSKPRPGELTHGHFKMGFTVQDIDKVLKFLKDEGITVDRVYKDQSTNKRNFLVNDPDGNLIQFFEG
jgi:glyoxylase I family protein